MQLFYIYFTFMISALMLGTPDLFLEETRPRISPLKFPIIVLYHLSTNVTAHFNWRLHMIHRSVNFFN